MIGIYSDGAEMAKQISSEFYPFFLPDFFDDAIILIFHAGGDCDKEQVFLERLLRKCVFIRGFHRQRRENIDILSPEFDYLYDIFFEFPYQEAVDSFDFVVGPNERLRNELNEVADFISKIKKYRLSVRYGKKAELGFPLLWGGFKNGFFAKSEADYVLKNSNFVVFPKFGTGGIGKFSMMCLSAERDYFINSVKFIANEEKVDISEIADKKGLWFY
ncbi:hypothetical protein CO611_05930 [Lysobacteraceae bacterium NML03-0222]|nr:hypothetical protein CO611_05930 [Xanthomonadaceae bacterium NML03-0222]PJK06140.1 hypothetical protein CO612_03960 [Xanthomonadaceae bacterium NML71-0210]